jgi:hypothetical protein
LDDDMLLTELRNASLFDLDRLQAACRPAPAIAAARGCRPTAFLAASDENHAWLSHGLITCEKGSIALAGFLIQFDVHAELANSTSS